ncbi:hypothetical protein NQ036_01405 [Brevibacterium sp. 91QC2O2]|uniref:hypothetical protein n=1 Tax=Brevibacterium TaxID=1696 RepID=UPI00211C9069|nr:MULTISPECIES: hypothetical protein [unclassified Brevibacterium]MCQ9366907.1 hypothetical protein [Brevibacterium sp. 91QC2O2]MCQ9384057.1 hypothetical protein [Brevibacterium sp. 68QC2CO]
MSTCEESAPVDGLLRPTADVDRDTLRSLALDGLLVQLTEDCWVAADAPAGPRLRAAALGPPQLADTAYSHATAHWVWWGSGRSPVTVHLTTLKRRRLRGNYAAHTFERTLGPFDVSRPAAVPVTTGARTLFDEAMAIETRDPARLAAAITTLLVDVGRADRLAFGEYVDGLYRRSGITVLRRALELVEL